MHTQEEEELNLILHYVVIAVLPAIIDRLGDGKEQVNWHYLALFGRL